MTQWEVDHASMPWKMDCDYVRVYQAAPGTPPSAPMAVAQRADITVSTAKSLASRRMKSGAEHLVGPAQKVFKPLIYANRRKTRAFPD